MKIVLTIILTLAVAATAIYFRSSIQEPTIQCPDTVQANSLFEVTANQPGKWLIRGAQYIQKDNCVIIASGTEDIEIIFSPGLIVKTIKVTTEPILSDFTKLIQSWAPTEGRPLVAASLLALGQSDIEEIEDFIKLTRLNNRALISDQWKSFFVKLSEYCEENLKDSSIEEHKELWIKIAKSLEEQP
jgi:hypothetical protein